MNKQNSFWKEIRDKLISPWKQSAFNGVFFITNFIAFFAILFPFIINKEIDSYNLSISISTYFLASIVSSAIDLSLSQSINKASFAIYTISSLVIIFIMFVLAVSFKDNKSLLFAIIGYLFSIIIWILANSGKSIFDDKKYNNIMDKSIIETNNYQEMLNQVSSDE